MRFFKDRLDVTIPVLFYPVPASRGGVPSTPFTNRQWDWKREPVDGTGIGPIWSTAVNYFGPVPEGALSPLAGTPAMWLHGLEYERWLAGEYKGGRRCFNTAPARRIKLEQSQGIHVQDGITPAYLRQVQTVSAPAYPVVAFPTLAQAERVLGSPVPAAALAQAQRVQCIPVHLSLAAISQAQSVSASGIGVAGVQVSQAEDVSAAALAVAPSLVSQAHQVGAVGLGLAPLSVEQAHAVGVIPVGLASAVLAQAQAVLVEVPEAVLLYSVDASNVATIDVTGLSGYDVIEVFGFNFQSIAGTSPDLWLRTSSNGGSTYDSGGSDYQSGFGTDSKIKLATLPSTSGANKTFNFRALMQGFQGSSLHKMVLFEAYVWDGTSQTYTGGFSGMGTRLSASAVNAFRLLASSGNVNGSLRVFGRQ